MSKTTVTIDFETVDPYLSEYNCSGWVYGDIRVLCCGVKINDARTLIYDLRDSDVMQDFRDLMHVCDTEDHLFIAHNAQYELGVLEMLGLRPKKALTVCTKLLAYLDRNTRNSNKLEDLAVEVLGEQKQGTALADEIKKHGDALNITKATDCQTLAYKNMDLLYDTAPELVEQYCRQDVDLTHKLYHVFMSGLSVDAEFYSDLLNCMVENRKRGVRIDLTKVDCVVSVLEDRYLADLKQIKTITQNDSININSTKQLAEYFDTVGVAYGLTKKGNPSINGKFLERQDMDVCRLIVSAKKYLKASGEVRKYKQMARNISKDGKYGYLYPEFKVFGAVTGRLSCSGPNIQQVPKRDAVIGPLCRSIFVAHEGEDWYSFDYSSQEPRLQVHYASLLKCPAVSDIRKTFISRPETDLHKLSSMAIFGKYDSEDRNLVKSINLGLSYGKGPVKLSIDSQSAMFMELAEKKLKEIEPALGELSHCSFDRFPKLIKTVIGNIQRNEPALKNTPGFVIIRDERPIFNYYFKHYINGTELKALYNKKFPFLSQCIEVVTDTARKRGYIWSLSRRKLYVEPDAVYKVFNALIQGSAGDQTLTAMVACYRLGIPVLFSVHDELDASLPKGESGEKMAKKIREIMETCIPLDIPMVVEYNKGKTWGDAK